MKIAKYLGVATLLATGLATGAHAADTVTFAAAGSSAQFATFTQAFLNSGYSNHYSLGSSANFQIHDAGAPNENAQVAIYWSGASGSYNIAVFYQVDSTVGVRAFFNSDTLTAPATAPAPTNVGLPGSGDVAVPAEILTAINGAAVTVGATDITPEDARVATQRSINLGYNATTNPIKSAVSAASVANPVAFTIPASGGFKLTPLGAVPIVVFINNNSGSDFASLSGPNLNINSFQLAGFLSGQFNRTSDLDLTSGAPQNPVHTYVREPLSGTYNTLEYTNAEALAEIPFTSGKPSGQIAASGGQELGVGTHNPLNEPAGSYAANGVTNAGRIRAVGTGQLIGAVNTDATDSLGYAFYSVGAFKGKTNLRYLTVDGADPLLDSYAGGSLTSPGTVTFRNIVNGGYPLWSILRVVTAASPTAAISTIVTAAQNANLGTDFVPFNSLRVFRSYHQTPYTPGGASAVSNGNNVANGGLPTAGGDVGGAVFSINEDQDNFNDFGGDLINLRQ